MIVSITFNTTLMNICIFDLHRLGVRRLYCGPSRRMMRPRRMKLAATSGVGATTSVTALYTHERRTQRWPSQCTHCMIYGFRRNGFWLDHNRLLQPISSRKPQKIALGISHHRREWMACTVWTTTRDSMVSNNLKSKRRKQAYM
jgi:hypothetical protein